jgi:hypothetical protein
MEVFKEASARQVMKASLAGTQLIISSVIA